MIMLIQISHFYVVFQQNKKKRDKCQDCHETAVCGSYNFKSIMDRYIQNDIKVV